MVVRATACVVLVFLCLQGLVVPSVGHSTENNEGLVSSMNYSASDYILWDDGDEFLLYGDGRTWTNGTELETGQNFSLNMTLSPSVVQSCFEALESDGFWSLADKCVDRYYSGRSKLVWPTDSLTVAVGDRTKRVEFGGNAMLGLLPKSFTTLDNIAGALYRDDDRPLDVALELNLTQSSDVPSLFTMRGTFVNHENFTLYGTSVGVILWVTIVGSDGTTVYPILPEAVAQVMVDWSVGPSSSYELNGVVWNRTFSSGSYIVAGWLGVGYSYDYADQDILRNYTVLTIKGPGSIFGSPETKIVVVGATMGVGIALAVAVAIRLRRRHTAA